jgi:hypothetical protein
MDLWQDQGFMPVGDLHYEDSSVRRTTFESYTGGVDWPDVAHVERSLRVFEWQPRWLARQEWHRPISSSTAWPAARRAVGYRPSGVSMSSLSPSSSGRQPSGVTPSSSCNAASVWTCSLVAG